ncbi:MAG: DUF1189 family protein [Planctomycetes bacterium]|nr:DUF1189 family protein [Planctomycetota bacterium]
MKRYSMFHVPYMSFYSGDLYWDVCHNWKGVGFLYLFLLLAVCWIPRAITIQGDVAAFVETEAPPIVTQIPQITVAGGEASADVNQPYAIVDPMTKKELAIIDTTGQITSLTEQEANILVTKKELIVRRTNLDTRSLPFDPDIDFTLDQHKVTRWLNTLRRVTAVWIYPLALLGSWFFRVIQLLIYALIGLQFARSLHSRRTYDSLLRLSAVAVTPAIIVNTILGVAAIQIPMPGLCYFLAAMCCLYFGIKSAALSAEAASEEDSGSPGMTHIE